MLAIPERTIESRSYLKFRCRLDSEDGVDVHRSFSGVYYPRWRSLYLDEVREVGRATKLFTVFDLTVMHKANGDYFFPDDFVEGAKLQLGLSPYSRDRAVKTFVITSVDPAHLAGWRQPANVPHDAPARQVHSPLLRDIKNALIQRSGCMEQAIKDCGKWFRRPDTTGQRVVSYQSFRNMLKDLQVECDNSEIEKMFQDFGSDAESTILFDDFVSQLRGKMSEKRKRAIADVFAQLDRDHDGFVPFVDLAGAYNASCHPDVQAGAATEAQVRNGFMAVWDSRDTNGTVGFAEFNDYYGGISASIEDDDVFVDTVYRMWRL